jgi:hypothetical protein
MRTITGKLVICAILISLAFAPMNRSSAQFSCESGGGGGDPTPTPTPNTCYYEYWDYYEYNCDPGSWSCCDDYYFVTDHYCYGVLESRDVQLISHSCRECDGFFPC